MDGSILIVLLLVSYSIYKIFRYGDPLKTEENAKVPKQYYKAYRTYLQSAEWEELRDIRFMIDDYMCLRCGTTSRLQCHHTNYSGIETMTFFLSQLETVCHSCHTKIHQRKLPMKL